MLNAPPHPVGSHFRLRLLSISLSHKHRLLNLIAEHLCQNGGQEINVHLQGKLKLHKPLSLSLSMLLIRNNQYQHKIVPVLPLGLGALIALSGHFYCQFTSSLNEAHCDEIGCISLIGF